MTSFTYTLARHAVITMIAGLFFASAMAIVPMKAHAASPEAQLQDVLKQTEDILITMNHQVSGPEFAGNGLVLSATTDGLDNILSTTPDTYFTNISPSSGTYLIGKSIAVSWTASSLVNQTPANENQ